MPSVHCLSISTPTSGVETYCTVVEDFCSDKVACLVRDVLAWNPLAAPDRHELLPPHVTQDPQSRRHYHAQDKPSSYPTNGCCCSLTYPVLPASTAAAFRSRLGGPFFLSYEMGRFVGFRASGPARLRQSLFAKKTDRPGSGSLQLTKF